MSRVSSEGDPLTAKYVMVGEAPGRDEILLGRPFVGPAGHVLNGFLEMGGIDREDCYITNVCKTRPPGNHMTFRIWKASLPSFLKEIQGIPVSTPILALGQWARNALCPNAQGEGVVVGRKWRRAITGHKVLSTVHPAYILHTGGQARMLFMDIQKLIRGPMHLSEPEYVVLRSWEALTDFIDWLYNNKDPGAFVAYDLECNGLDFQRDRVLDISITYEPGKAVIIPDGMIYKNADVLHADWITPRYTNAYTGEQLEALFDMDFTFVAHNSLFDLKFLKGQLGIETARCDFDTLLAHYALWEEKGTHGLKQLGTEFFDMHDWEGDLDKYKPKKRGYSAIPREVLYRYATWDTEVTYQLAVLFKRMLQKEGMYEKPFLFPIMTYVPMLSESEIKGFPIDAEYLRRLDEEEIGPALVRLGGTLGAMAREYAAPFDTEEERFFLHLIRKTLVRDMTDEVQARRLLAKSAVAMMEGELNPNSSQQMSTLIYDFIGIPTVQARTRSRGKHLSARSTAKESQDKIIDRYRNVILASMSPVQTEELRSTFNDIGPDSDIAKWSRGRDVDLVNNLDKLVEWYCRVYGTAAVPGWLSPKSYALLMQMKEYRRVAKMRSSYVTNLLRLEGPDGRVHTSYLIPGTVTGRLSASEPAIQTIPRQDQKWGKAISNAFVAPPGYSLVYADYSQCELRVAADVSQDPFMLQSYRRENPDIHTDVAIAIYGPNYTVEQRNWYCKRAIFGWLYGGNLYEIARDALRFPDHMARKFEREWNTNFAVMAQWREDAGARALKEGEVVSRFGRKRRFLLITRQNKMDIIHAGQNHPMQSGAADMTLISASRVTAKWEHELRVWLAVTVHDSNLFIAPDELVPQVARDLQGIMVDTGGEFYPTVPHQVELRVGKKWGSLHKYVLEEAA